MASSYPVVMVVPSAEAPQKKSQISHPRPPSAIYLCDCINYTAAVYPVKQMCGPDAGGGGEETVGFVFQS